MVADRKVGAKSIARRLSLLIAHIEQNYDCANCGAKAGEPCKPEFGCDEWDRLASTPLLTQNDKRLVRDGLLQLRGHLLGRGWRMTDSAHRRVHDIDRLIVKYDVDRLLGRFRERRETSETTHQRPG